MCLYYLYFYIFFIYIIKYVVWDLITATYSLPQLDIKLQYFLFLINRLDILLSCQKLQLCTEKLEDLKMFDTSKIVLTIGLISEVWFSYKVSFNSKMSL